MRHWFANRPIKEKIFLYIPDILLPLLLLAVFVILVLDNRLTLKRKIFQNAPLIATRLTAFGNTERCGNNLL